MVELQRERHNNRLQYPEFSNDASSFSIIIPTYNRPVQLGNCLDCLTRLDFPKIQYEVVIVDDGSSSSMETEHSQFYTSNNMAMDRDIFDTVGGFDSNFPGLFGEDREFCDRWRFLLDSASEKFPI
jgi:glycosyltransferase involved in cell wall biosynthesis